MPKSGLFRRPFFRLLCAADHLLVHILGVFWIVGIGSGSRSSQELNIVVIFRETSCQDWSQNTMNHVGNIPAGHVFRLQCRSRNWRCIWMRIAIGSHLRWNRSSWSVLPCWTGMGHRNHGRMRLVGWSHWHHASWRGHCSRWHPHGGSHWDSSDNRTLRWHCPGWRHLPRRGHLHLHLHDTRMRTRMGPWWRRARWHGSPVHGNSSHLWWDIGLSWRRRHAYIVISLWRWWNISSFWHWRLGWFCLNACRRSHVATIRKVHRVLWCFGNGCWFGCWNRLCSSWRCKSRRPTKPRGCIQRRLLSNIVIFCSLEITTVWSRRDKTGWHCRLLTLFPDRVCSEKIIL
mmetsp:Transcript_14093/g.34154  ORF Transcript_14093/g.34154 Transcript_14093/m.34154 type:complete len:344 (+) Transcript_14093:744-1775(+)